MVYKIIFCSQFHNIPDEAGRITIIIRRTQTIAKHSAFHGNAKICLKKMFKKKTGY